jgi:hypothetical protein
MAERNQYQGSVGLPLNTPGNGQPPPLLEKPGEPTPPSQVVPRKASGPRTDQGKKRTRSNALKHGVLSKFALLEGESEEEYRTLFIGLRDYFQPQGKMEYILVEELTIGVWRKRRLIAAETGTISEKITFIETKMRAKQAAEALQLSRDEILSDGLVAHDDNPFVIEEIINIWETVRQLVTKGTLGDCSPFINRLYGMNQYGIAPDQFRHSFEIYFDVMKLGETKGDPSKLAEMKQMMIEMIDGEIERFSKLKELREEIDRQKILFKKRTGVIPSGRGADLLLRYQTQSSREIDRILNRLEWLQRRRNGQRLPPQLDIRIS